MVFHQTPPPSRAGEDRSYPPGLDMLLALAGIAPFILCGLLSLNSQPRPIAMAAAVTTAYGGALLCFLGGVRRGLSFRQAGGPTKQQLVSSAWYFFLGVSSLTVTWPQASMLLLTLGLLSSLVLDVIAARRGEVPPYFQTLRPVQMTFAIASVLIVLARSTTL